MSEPFLYEELDALSKHGNLKKEIPSFLKEGLNPKFKLRPYQKEAFARFFHCLNKDFPGKTHPLHLLFNMATGSGKTLIMAGLILYLYKKGYRNFLFFVHSTNIIEKTKNNFLNPLSSKYLFAENIVFERKRVSISSVQNFEGINPNDINIAFTTIQKLHSDLSTVKENSLTYQDFEDKKIVLLSDEAHHISAKTKGQKDLPFKEKPTWENTVEKIFNQNKENLLLEFTATLDWTHKNIREKYRRKALYKYDLKEFRNGGWSKDVYIVQADFGQKDRILQALILSQYKQEVATKYRLRLKPVILFKAQKFIRHSEENKKDFHKMIESLNAKDIERIKTKSNLPIVGKAFAFFKSQGISLSGLARRLREEFQESRCLSVNEESEKEKNQILLNTLEDEANLIRAVFAVEKLNEGWDVLNLFDIVRCYETRDSGRGKSGKTTTKEAQLIGRGARYFPFVVSPSAIPAQGGNPGGLSDHENPYKRKFDQNLGHELRLLEELHYHSINDNKYISEIRAELIKTGIMEEKKIIKQLQLKETFKKTDFYQKGLVYINKRVKNRYKNIRSISDMGVSLKNHVHKIFAGKGTITKAFPIEGGTQGTIPEGKRQELKLKALPFHIIQNAVSRNDFFIFSSLKKYFPRIQSVREFIQDEEYLGDQAITFQGGKPSKKDILEGLSGLLEKIQNEMRENITEYKGTEKFEEHLVSHVFTDKEIKISPSAINGAHVFTEEKDWYVFKAFHGTSEEKAFIQMLESQMDRLREKYDEIYLVRNEKHFKIYNFKDGRGFEPDFVLFLKERSGNMLTYQMFIEPKGEHLKEHDKWKEDFLEDIRKKFKNRTLDFITRAGTQKYRLTAAPFYNNKGENEFKESLYSALDE